MTATCAMSASSGRSCVTFTAIRLRPGYASVRKTGSGAVFVTTRCEKKESSKSSPSGRRGIGRGKNIPDPRLAPKAGANLGHPPKAGANLGHPPEMVKPALRTKSIGFKVSEEEYAQLDAAAQGSGRSLGEWCREALLETACGPEETKPTAPASRRGIGRGKRKGVRKEYS